MPPVLARALAAFSRRAPRAQYGLDGARGWAGEDNPVTDPLAQAEAVLEHALDAVHAAENSTPADDSVAVPSAVAETAEPSPIAKLVEAALAASATPPKPRYLDMGKGYLGPTAVNGT